MCCLAWIFAGLFFFFLGGFLLVLKETFIVGAVDAGDQVMGFTVAKVPLQIEFRDGELREERGRGNKKSNGVYFYFLKFREKIVFLDEIGRF